MALWQVLGYNQFETPGNVGLGLTRRAVAEIDRIMHSHPVEITTI